MKTKPHIAVDFDGVIHRYSKGWHDGTIYDVPMVGAKEALEKLSQKYDVIIFTTRLSPTLRGDSLLLHENELRDWLDKYGFQKGVHYSEFTAIKPKAKIYLDDRGLRFENWAKALEDIDLYT